MTHGFDRRNFIKAGLATGVLALPVFENAANASVPSITGQFDLSYGFQPFPNLNGVQLHRKPYIMQSFVFDSLNQHVYVAQVTGATCNYAALGDPCVSPNVNVSHVQHGERGDLTITQLDMAGTILGAMCLEGCGHGFAMGVNNSPDGTPWIWVEFKPILNTIDDCGYGTQVTRFHWDSTRTEANPMRASELTAHYHNPRPNTFSNSCSIDPINNLFALRYQLSDGNGHPISTKKVAVWNLVDIESSHYSSPLADITLPSAVLTDAQGFTIYGDYLYFIGGTSNSTCPGGSGTSGVSTIRKLNINTNSVIQTYYMNNDCGIVDREPEGIAVYYPNHPQATGARLCAGLAGADPLNDGSDAIYLYYNGHFA